ncbi:hypothetical protein Trydic_g18377 [Trypoxylus dichotomus]
MLEQTVLDDIKKSFRSRALERKRYKEWSPTIGAHPPKALKPFGEVKSTSLWTKQMDNTAKLKTLGYGSNWQLLTKEKSREKEMLGPGHYEVRADICRKSNISEGKSFTTSQRYDVTAKANNPPPGAYFHNILERSFVLKKHFGNKSIMGECYRWKQPRMLTNTIPPNRYNPRYSSIDGLLRKVGSTRGPCNLFTGPRDETTIKNHFGVGKPEGSDKLFLPQSDLDFLLKHPSKKYFGIVYRRRKFDQLKLYLSVYQQKDVSCKILKETSPGPCTYNVTTHTIKPAQPAKVPFNTTASKTAPIVYRSPGPGTYFKEDREPEISPKRRGQDKTLTKVHRLPKRVAPVKLRRRKHRSIISARAILRTTKPIVTQQESDQEREGEDYCNTTDGTTISVDYPDINATVVNMTRNYKRYC